MVEVAPWSSMVEDVLRAFYDMSSPGGAAPRGRARVLDPPVRCGASSRSAPCGTGGTADGGADQHALAEP